VSEPVSIFSLRQVIEIHSSGKDKDRNQETGRKTLDPKQIPTGVPSGPAATLASTTDGTPGRGVRRVEARP
jgi:hypothetical protein